MVATRLRITGTTGTTGTKKITKLRKPLYQKKLTSPSNVVVHKTKGQRRTEFLIAQQRKRSACFEEEKYVVSRLSKTHTFFSILKQRIHVRCKYYTSFALYYYKRIIAVDKMKEGLDKVEQIYKLAYEVDHWTFTIDNDEMKTIYASYGLVWPPKIDTSEIVEC